VKEYIHIKGYRKIPVGSATYQYDMSTVPQYMNCGENNSSADFLGLDLTYMADIKSQCRNVSSWLESDSLEDYRGYSIPTFLIYGCNVHIRKDFSEVRTIYSNTATEVFSGVVMFGWQDESESWDDFGETLDLQLVAV
jgi:1,3-beta-glucanosyltransferase GAS4